MPQVTMTQAERARRKSRNRKILLGFFCFIGLVVALESPLTRVRSITVSGNTTVALADIIHDSGLHKGESLWQVRNQHVVSQISAQEPMVESTHVSVNWADGNVHISVHERNIVAVYVFSGKFYELLNDGVVYNTTKPSNGLSFPVITSSTKQVAVGQAVSPEVTKLCAQLSHIDPSGIANVSELHANGDGTVSLYLDNGFVVTCDATGLKQATSEMETAVHYFVKKGYKPGNIDLSGVPPYLYTPFSTSPGSGSKKGANS